VHLPSQSATTIFPHRTCKQQIPQTNLQTNSTHANLHRAICKSQYQITQTGQITIIHQIGRAKTTQATTLASLCTPNLSSQPPFTTAKGPSLHRRASPPSCPAPSSICCTETKIKENLEESSPLHRCSSPSVDSDADDASASVSPFPVRQPPQQTAPLSPGAAQAAASNFSPQLPLPGIDLPCLLLATAAAIASSHAATSPHGSLLSAEKKKIKSARKERGQKRTKESKVKKGRRRREKERKKKKREKKEENDQGPKWSKQTLGAHIILLGVRSKKRKRRKRRK
jgi:hypothetical protein